jgi:alkylated DNA repair protein alkB family protein 1
VLTKKLRWLTLGGQYDWTAKRYQSQSTPDFPEDVAKLVHGLFPDIVPQAAILNLYTPGDTLAPHRDISEKSRKGLVSISIGCAGIFVIGIDGGDGKEGEVLAVRLNSGDVVVMGGESRWAWHSVPKILQGTCPEELEAWPNNQWDGWMKGKRVNLNIRQMWD